jgi:Domain of unknown function (DUF4263)
MQVPAFTTRCLRHCYKYFNQIHRDARAGLLTHSRGGYAYPVYPTMLLICETPTHLYGELLGASPRLPTSLTVVTRRLPSRGHVLGLLDPRNSFNGIVIPGEGARIISGGTFFAERDRSLFMTRYPELASANRGGMFFTGPATNQAFNVFGFMGEKGSLWLADVLTVNSWRGQVRARYFQAAWLFDRCSSSSELQRQFKEFHPIDDAKPRLVVPERPNLPGQPSRRSVFTRAANFATIPNIETLGETTITKFLELNADLLSNALGGASLIPQPYLPWLSGNPDPSESAVIPDFLLVDDQGQAHICEVKLPLLGANSLTTGGHKRRRFTAPVADGVAQLANYVDYFSHVEHQQLLRRKYGVSIDSPRSILIVGSAENFDEQEVTQAQRMLTPVGNRGLRQPSGLVSSPPRLRSRRIRGGQCRVRVLAPSVLGAAPLFSATHPGPPR